MQYFGSKCNDTDCVYRTSLGYCSVTGCRKMSGSITTTVADPGNYIEVVKQTSATDQGVKEYIELYLKDHSLSDLMRILADIV